MTAHIRAKVSKNKRRYICDGYNLDLSYIEPNIIAMGYPAENLEGIYRNQLDVVAKFLNEKHPGKYKIYNLCKERERNNYPKEKFGGDGAVCEEFCFEDHAPPPLEIIEPFCQDVARWLALDNTNVVAVHCKAGKGRTGVMISCYLIHCGKYNTAEEALSHYAKIRTTDNKGVTIPSQRRYVGYYTELMTSNPRLSYTPTKLALRSIRVENLSMNFAASLGFSVYYDTTRKVSVNMGDIKGRGSCWTHNLTDSIVVSGDVRVEFHKSPLLIPSKEKIFLACFNTFFIHDEPPADMIPPDMKQNGDSCSEGGKESLELGGIGVGAGGGSGLQGNAQRYRVLCFSKNQLDKACKTKELSDSIRISFLFDALDGSSSCCAAGNARATAGENEADSLCKRNSAQSGSKSGSDVGDSVRPEEDSSSEDDDEVQQVANSFVRM